MGRIQSSIGLITGVPISDTVDQLIALSAKPRDLLQSRVSKMQDQQIAVGELTALTIAMQMSAKKLADAEVFQQRQVTSSNDSLLAAAVTGDPTPGTYRFTPVSVAQNHQMISDGVAGLEEALGGGEMQLRFGGFVDQGVQLEILNGGSGVQRGKIRITDRSGASEVVDLRFAVTLDDVIQAINRGETVNVWAEADGDSIRLTDQTGQTASNLKVQEIGFGTTAADLGLAGIDVATDSATGQDVLQLFNDLLVGTLNDNNGLSIRDELPDLELSFRDGSSPLQIDLFRQDIKTLGDLLDALNAADPARLQADFSADGDRLVLTDLTGAGGGTFAVSSPVGGTLAEDLGLTTTAAGNALTGRRLLGGLKGALLSSLVGGQGMGSLGQISLTDRSGANATVDLANAETLADVVNLINASGVAISARINQPRNGIQLVDTSGATAGNLVVANADATNSADKLGIAFDAAETSVNSGALGLQTIHEDSKLSDFNYGNGVHLGSILITDSAGQSSGINLATMDAQTIGDVIEAINGLNIGVEARVNLSGDGIMLLDTAAGSGTLTVAEGGNGTTAADLGLLGSGVVKDINGTPTQVIDGAMTVSLQMGANETIQDLVDKINALDMGVKASLFNSGTGSRPYRILLISEVSGTDGEIMLDTSDLGLGFQEIVRAQDAALLVGSADAPGAGILATSSSNRFEDVIDGVQLTVGGVSDTPVTIQIETTDSKLVSAIELFVDQYNKLQGKIDELTYFNEYDNSTGILFGSNETLRVETTLANIVTDRFFGAGDIDSLEQIGVSVNDEGKLELDNEKLQARFEQDPEAVETFFTDEQFGFASKFDAALESLAGEDNSLLINRNESLQRKIDQNNDKINFWNDRLDTKRELLLKQFYAMETAIAKIQANMSAIQSLAALPPMV